MRISPSNVSREGTTVSVAETRVGLALSGKRSFGEGTFSAAAGTCADEALGADEATGRGGVWLGLSAHEARPDTSSASIPDETGRSTRTLKSRNEGLPGEDFWQFNVWAGYRFARRRAEVRIGLLNITDQEYQLNPLNLHAVLPHDRTLAVNVRFSF